MVEHQENEMHVGRNMIEFVSQSLTLRIGYFSHKLSSTSKSALAAHPE
jgi:hypothetical protein